MAVHIDVIQIGAAASLGSVRQAASGKNNFFAGRAAAQKGLRYDSKTRLRKISALFSENKSEDRQETKPWHFQEPQRRGKTRAGGAILQTRLSGTTYSLIGLPKYKKMEDLKGGTRLAMSGITSAAALMMKQMLKERGVLYPRDYSLLSIGGSTTQFTALQSGQVDGALLAQPLSIMAVEQGFSNLGDAYKLMPDYQLSAIGVREGWAQKNRSVVVRYLKALVSTYRWLHDDREEAIKILPAITKLEPKYIAKSWETYTQTQIWPRNGGVNLKGVQTVLNLIAEEGMIKKPLPKPEDIVDASFLDEARKALPR